MSEGGNARRARNLFIELEDERQDIVHAGTPRGRAASLEPRRVTARKVARLQALGAGCGRARAGGRVQLVRRDGRDVSTLYGVGWDLDSF